MDVRWWARAAGVLATGALIAGGGGMARGQMAAAGERSLGGYGEAAIGRFLRSGNGPVLPYAGGMGGFMPYRGVEAPEPSRAAMMPRRVVETPIGGASWMVTPRGGMAGRSFLPFGGGMGPIGGPRLIPTRTGRSPTRTGFGYPFRRPPSLAGGGGLGAMP